jgi:hypothetical protein
MPRVRQQLKGNTMQPQYAPPMPQFPQQPAAYPTQPVYPQQPYPAAPAPQYPQQGYPQGYAQPQYAPQQYAPAPAPAAPLPTGTLDGFYEQPSGGGGPSFKFNGKPVGTQYVGIVARTVTNADVRAQTNNAGQVQTFKDGRPKFVMVVPMQVQPSPEFPDGMAGWWVKGQARDELARAMAEAGAPAGAPEAGAAIRITLTGQRNVPNMNPQLLYRVEYVRPNGAAPAPQPVAQPVQMAPQPMPQPAPMPVQQQMAPQPQYAPAPGQMAPQPMAQPVVAQGGPVEQYNNPATGDAPAPQATPAGFNPEQAALFAKLTGQAG